MAADRLPQLHAAGGALQGAVTHPLGRAEAARYAPATAAVTDYRSGALGLWGSEAGRQADGQAGRRGGWQVHGAWCSWRSLYKYMGCSLLTFGLGQCLFFRAGSRAGLNMPNARLWLTVQQLAAQAHVVSMDSSEPVLRRYAALQASAVSVLRTVGRQKNIWPMPV